jgi:thiamine biosynthesis protein ThiS
MLPCGVMQIIINGLEQQVRQGLTVAELLAVEQEPRDHVLVEVNGAYVPATEYDSLVLQAGDRVEFILPAYGG